MKKALLIFCFGLFAAFSQAQSITDDINTILARTAVAGNSWTILVENRDGSTIYYQKNPTTGLAPASNTKMFTTAAAIGLLGTNYAFQTKIFRDGTITSGTLAGNLNLVCEYDPTWNTSVFSGNARKPLDTIAVALKAQGLNAVSGNVQCYGVCSYNYSSTGDLQGDTFLERNTNAAVAFKAALVAAGITVSGSAIGQNGFSPPGTLQHTYYSTNNTYGGKPLRLDVACIPLLKVSHNVMADVMLRHIGWKLGAGDSYTSGRNVVVPWLKNSAGLTTNGIVMNDGSGLSHGNRFNARQHISLTRYMLAAFPSWDDGLPIGCTDGTLGSRFCGTDGDGTVHAKTGSLSISIALSGYIDNPDDNQRYLFSFLGNDSGGIDQTATRDAIDDCVVLFGARRVPIGPQLSRVKNNADGNSLAAFWNDDGFIRTSYNVYASSNGVNFAAPINVSSNTHSFTETNLPYGTKRYYKVTAVGSGGESKASRIYGAQVGNFASRLLIVDGDDRWQFLPAENPNCTNHNFAAIAGQAINGPAFTTASQGAIMDGTIKMTNFDAVVWLSGEESTADESFSTTEQSLMTEYLDVGGNLFLSGSEIGWDLDRTGTGPTTADRNFYRSEFRAAYNSDDANTYAFKPATGGIFAGIAQSGFDNGTRGTYNVDFPDVLTTTNGSVAALTYVGGTGGNAAVSYDGSLGGGRLVNFGFPFETVTNAAIREAYMTATLKFFGFLQQPVFQSADFGGNSILLSWSSTTNQRYRVQYNVDFNSTNWQALGNDIKATNNLSFKLDSTISASTQRFYRVWLTY